MKKLLMVVMTMAFRRGNRLLRWNSEFWLPGPPTQMSTMPTANVVRWFTEPKIDWAPTVAKPGGS